MTLNFICRASKARRNGLSPIELSVIIDGNRSIITLDRQVHHTKFNTVKQIVKGDKETNEYLFVVLFQNNLYICNYIPNNPNRRRCRGVTINV